MGAQKSIHAGKAKVDVNVDFTHKLCAALMLQPFRDSGSPLSLVIGSLCIKHPNLFGKSEKLDLLWDKGLYDSNVLIAYRKPRPEWLTQQSFVTQVVFWKWIIPKLLGLVTQAYVYHWSIEGDSEPVKVFDRTTNLANNQIINYRCDPSEKWLVLIGITPGSLEEFPSDMVWCFNFESHKNMQSLQMEFEKRKSRQTF